MSDPLLGQMINGKFRVQAVLGRGGMGRVYRAEQLPLGRVCALKVLHSRPGAQELDPAFQRRFFLEASLCAKLSHPNVVTIYDYGRIEVPALDEDAYFMAMEFLEGETLQHRLKTAAGPLDPGDALALALEVSRGLREAHRHGLVHRDLKPGNVMLVPDPEAGEKVKILDFGLVKQLEGDTEDLTQENAFVGSPKYMAPEQIERSNVDHRVDLYALGVILYECLTGRVPFEESNSMHTLLAHVQKPVPPMRERALGVPVPEALEAVTRKLLEKKPEQRFANAEELTRELRMLQQRLGLASSMATAMPTSTALSLVVPAAEVFPVDPSGSLMGAARPVTSTLPGATGTQVAAGGSRTPVMAVAAVGVLALLAGVGLVLRKPAQVSAASTPSAAPTGELRAQSHTLTLESSPPGATVSEGGRSLGTTPVRITLDEGQLSPREFVLSLAGHTPYTFRQPPTHDDVRMSAELSRESSAAPATAVASAAPSADPPANLQGGPRIAPRPAVARPRPAPAVPVARPSAAAAPSAPSPLDIRDER